MSEVCYAVPLKEEVVHVDIKALAVTRSEVLLSILKKECSLANATSTLDAYHAVVPVYFVH
jgi:hypothetical protein